MNKIAYLSVTCFDLAGGIHFYGRICFRHVDKLEDINVEQICTRKIAKELNKDDVRRGDPPTYKVGNLTSKFLDEKSLIERAIVVLKEQRPEYDILLKGSTSVLDPMPVLTAPEPLKTKLDNLVAGAELLGYWDRKENEAAMELIFTEWRKELAI